MGVGEASKRKLGGLFVAFLCLFLLKIDIIRIVMHNKEWCALRL